MRRATCLAKTKQGGQVIHGKVPYSHPHNPNPPCSHPTLHSDIAKQVAGNMLHVNIVNRETGYETLPWKQWCCNLCWKGRDPAQSFVLTFTPQLNILTKTFRLVSCSNTFQNLLLFVQGQGQKGKQKHITKKFVRFHNHCLWLTLM